MDEHVANKTCYSFKIGEQHAYVMATRQDYDNTMALWQEVRETTETSAASHHLRFFHEVVEPTAKQKPTFTIKDLTDAWNAKFSDRKSSDTIRNYVDFLCLIGYMSKIPDPADKRQNLLEVIQEKSGKYTQNELSAFFTLESFKEWLDEAQTITEENQILLKESLTADARTTPEAIYDKYFICQKENSSVNVLSSSQSFAVKSAEEKTDNQKIGQFPKIIPAYDILKNSFPGAFVQKDALDSISKAFAVDQIEAERIFQVSVEDGKLAMTPEGLWWFI